MKSPPRQLSKQKLSNRKSFSYAEAGVDIAAGNELVKIIKPFAKATSRKGADGSLGGFGALFDLKALKYKDPILVSGTDGVGTKLKIAQELGMHETIGIDLVAMCVNDIIVQGAEPLFFLDYFATGKLDNKTAAKVIKGIAEGCKQAGCALSGGETAEMPGMYKPGEYDLAGFSVGAVERKNLLPKKTLKNGDILIGLPSSGVHSNGFSLVRHIMEERLIDYKAKAPFAKGKSFGKVLLEPTRIYVKTCLELFKKVDIKALVHITGGGLLENIPRVLPGSVMAEIDCRSWKLPGIFSWLKAQGNVAPLEMLKTFNCGIGMVLIVAEKDVKKVSSILNDSNEEYFTIGSLRPRGKTKELVKFNNLKALE